MEQSTRTTGHGTTTDDVDHPMSGINSGASDTQPSLHQPPTAAERSSAPADAVQTSSLAGSTPTAPEAAGFTARPKDSVPIAETAHPAQGSQTLPAETQLRNITFEGMYSRQPRKLE